jgi:AraC-like DNA-binding protein
MLAPHLLREKIARVHVMTDSDPPLIAVAGRQSEPRVSGPHSHPSGQLLGLFSGLLTVRTRLGAWVVPTTRAVWIPPSHVHAARSHGPFSGWAVYVAPAWCAELPGEARTIKVSGLLLEAVLRAAQWELGAPDRKQKNVIDVVLDEIADAAPDEFGLPMPRDARLARIAAELADDPASPRTLIEWAQSANVAPRSLSRRFVAETGFTFTTWRQRARLMRALELLAAGQPVTAVALDLGYDNVSAFIALFRRTFGITPGRYFAATIEHDANALGQPVPRDDGSAGAQGLFVSQ